MSQKIWLSSPHMGGKELDFIQEAFNTNWVAPLGPNVAGFERDLESYLEESVHVAALSSGTAALHLALILAGVTRGDDVLCQSMTFSASANPIVYQGANPIFIDSEEETWNMSPSFLEKAIKEGIKNGKKPKAIILVHLYGMPAKLDEILKISKEYDITIIEDAAEALGSTYNGRKCGTFGDFSILSFNGNKIITTSGGGALVCNSSEEKEKAIFLATQARDNAIHYQHSHIGYNYRMSNIVAGIGRGQMMVLEDHVKLRRSMNVFYSNIFKNTKGIRLFEEPNTIFKSNHWLSAITIDEKELGCSTNDIREELLKDNIESRPLWKPMHLQPVFEHCDFYGDGTSQRLFENGLCLPSGSNLSESEKSRIEKALKRII